MTATYTNRRFYRGYSLKQRRDTGTWEIWRGERISIANALPEAEAIVDSWLEAK